MEDASGGGTAITTNKSDDKVKVSRYTCPVVGCDVMVYVAYEQENGDTVISDFRCEREFGCGIPLFDPCPLYVDLVERRGIRKIS